MKPLTFERIVKEFKEKEDELLRWKAGEYAPGGCYYGGSHDLQGIDVRYASDPRWAQKVAGCMKIIAEVSE